MCDEHYENDVEKKRLRLGLTRREFAAMTAAAGMSILLPHAAGAAVDVKEEEVNIKTPDGTADAYFVHPATAMARASLSGRTFWVCVPPSAQWVSDSRRKAILYSS